MDSTFNTYKHSIMCMLLRKLRGCQCMIQSFLSARLLSASGNVFFANALAPLPFPGAVLYLLRLIFGRLEGCAVDSDSLTAGVSFASFSRSEAVLFLWPSLSSSLLKIVEAGASVWNEAVFSPIRERRLPGPVGGAAFQSRSRAGTSDFPVRGPSLAIARGAEGVVGGKGFAVDAGASGIRFSAGFSSPSLSLRRRSGSRGRSWPVASDERRDLSS